MALVKTDRPALFSEVSVSYSFDKESIQEYGFKLFKYEWEYKPTKSKGIHEVYTFSASGLQKLIAYWNRTKSWHYTILD
jgi:hypothetical protein